MGNLANNSNFCLRLFGSSLTEDAFQWYLTLPAGSIKTWEEMQRAFTARFFVTRKDVTLADLVNIKQKGNEDVQTFIERWRLEANRCKMTIPEEEQVRFCRTGIKPSKNILLSEQITTFLSLANEACSKERALAQKAEEDRRKEAVGKAPKKEKGGTSANVAEVKENAGESKPKGQGSRPQNQREQITFTFKDEDVLPIFQALMFKEAIELPPIKYPDEVGREPKYCHFDRGVNHPTSQCFHQKKIIKKCIDKGIVRTK